MTIRNIEGLSAQTWQPESSQTLPKASAPTPAQLEDGKLVLVHTITIGKLRGDRPAGGRGLPFCAAQIGSTRRSWLACRRDHPFVRASWCGRSNRHGPADEQEPLWAPIQPSMLRYMKRTWEGGINASFIINRVFTSKPDIRKVRRGNPNAAPRCGARTMSVGECRRPGCRTGVAGCTEARAPAPERRKGCSGYGMPGQRTATSALSRSGCET